jgi:hypothetical protein
MMVAVRPNLLIGKHGIEWFAETKNAPAQRFVPDSPLEGDGFELPVPREMTTIFGPRCVR